MNVRREGVGSPEPPRDTCAGCQPAPTWAAESQARCGETRPATAVPNRIALQAFARSMLSPLRHPGFAEKATPALGHGQPLAASFPRSTGFQPVSVHRCGSGLPMPSRRTFVSALRASTLCMSAALRRAPIRRRRIGRGCACSHSPLEGMGSPSLSSRLSCAASNPTCR